MTKERVLDALFMAVWRRQPKQEVLIHSDQGSRCTSHDWSDFLKEHNLKDSMGRRGNCHDNAVAESFYYLLKRERVKKKIYPTRDAALLDLFNYIETFYKTNRRHGSNAILSPVRYEQQYFMKLESVQ